jgi:DNA replication and repair protein RecF
VYLKSLHLVNFKNYELADLTFLPAVNCFTGLNGSGKTNLLDAVHYLSVCKSFLNPADNQNIKQGEDLFVIQGKFDNNDSEDEIFCGLKRNSKKQFKRNQKEYERLADHVGSFPVVLISPEDSVLISGGSEERRRFIDNTLSQTDKSYLENLITYNKVLVQRNVALKQFAADRRFDSDLLAIYDEQLVMYGIPVYNTRKAFLDEFAGVFNANYQFICGGGGEFAKLEYKSQLDEGEFTDLLLAARDKDRINQYTTVGIHKDDIQFDMNGNAVKKFGSQGQQKSFIMSLKLAQFEYLYKVKKVKPLLLLDDLFDKLDDIRVQKILQMVSLGNFGQIFITHTDHTKLAAILKTTGTEYKIFDVQHGTVTA